MAFPTPFPDNVYSLRVYETGTGTAAFSGNEFEFFHPVKTAEVAWSQALRIIATVADLEFSFDGVNVHGKVLAGTEVVYWDRHESGIALRGLGSVFVLEAW
jgi:hypothetical protein